MGPIFGTGSDDPDAALRPVPFAYDCAHYSRCCCCCTHFLWQSGVDAKGTGSREWTRAFGNWDMGCEAEESASWGSRVVGCNDFRSDELGLTCTSSVSIVFPPTISLFEWTGQCPSLSVVYVSIGHTSALPIGTTHRLTTFGESQTNADGRSAPNNRQVLHGILHA